jgi:hypothetical protein
MININFNILVGMFLKRQKEVSSEFSEYIAKNILNSQRVWQSIMGGTKSDNFREIVRRNVPLPGAAIGTIIEQMQRNVGDVALHPLHYYTDIRLNLQVILVHIVYSISLLCSALSCLALISIYCNVHDAEGWH